MDYAEAWERLDNKLYRAKHSLNELISKQGIFPNYDEDLRLRSKREGIELAIGYMLDIKKIIAE